MPDTEDLLAIRVTNAPNQVVAIKSIRAATGLSMGDIKTALADRTTLPIAKLRGLDHDENEQSANTLFDQLENASVEFEIILDGELESRQHFANAMTRWREIGIYTEMMSDLESGEPCIETLEWLRSTGTTDVFQQTIRQIISADGYNVDDETLDWAKRQVNDA